MDFTAARRFHKKLVEVFREIPRDKSTLKLWNKNRVINRINDTFSDWMADELAELETKNETQPVALPEINDAQPSIEIPEWQPQTQEYDEDE